jgi:hypothetical protein
MTARAACLIALLELEGRRSAVQRHKARMSLAAQ